MSRVIIFGNKSYLQNSLYLFFKKKKLNVIKKNFSQLNLVVFQEKDIVINCSISSNFFHENYRKICDRNLTIAQLIKRKKIHFFMLSTRMVYKPQTDINESSKIKPINIYAKNCYISELNCRKVLDKKLTVLRISNVVGYEVRNKRQSLMSTLIKSIKLKKVILDGSLNFTKDIIPINFFCQYFYKLLSNPKSIVNLGSGVSFSLKRIVAILLRGKKVKIIINKENYIKSDNSYSYNINKLIKLTGLSFNKFQVLKELQKIRSKLKL